METSLAESKRVRTIPDFNIRDASDNIRRGVRYLILFSLCLIPFFVFYNATGSIIESIFPILCIFPAVLMFFIGGIMEIISGASVFANKKKWIKNAARTLGTIVKGEISAHLEYDEYLTYHVSVYELELKYTPIMAMTNSVEQTIWAYVDKSIYEKSEHRDSVFIYYSVEDPTIFFIGGE
jgi:hypothetical protein